MGAKCSKCPDCPACPTAPANSAPESLHNYRIMLLGIMQNQPNFNVPMDRLRLAWANVLHQNSATTIQDLAGTVKSPIETDIETWAEEQAKQAETLSLPPFTSDDPPFNDRMDNPETFHGNHRYRLRRRQRLLSSTAVLIAIIVFVLVQSAT